MAQEMARQLHIYRSDGRLYTTEEVNAKKKTTVIQVSEPIPEDVSQVTDSETRNRMASWKVVVATGISEELGWAKDSQYQLVFPEGYCLRWHSLGASKPKKQACVYGHPQDCSEDFLYRHPYEFVPHVLWLLSDSRDHKDCPCRPCHIATGRKYPQTFKEKMEKKAAAMALAASQTKPSSKKIVTTSTTKATTNTKKKTSASAAVPLTAPVGPDYGANAAKESSVPSKTTQKSAAANSPVAAPSAPLQPAVPTAVRHPALSDEPTLFRRGEMVWYQQDQAWRIGVIRQVGTGQTPVYVVVPLGHALLNLPDLQKQQNQMRPFLTFSVPALGIEDLQGKMFMQVDWQALLKIPGQRRDVVGLEASKMAAVEIDGSWSAFNQLPAGPKQPQKSLFGGVFLGAEMIRLGDPIRHKDKNRSTLLEVTEISVVPNPGDPNNGVPPSGDSVQPNPALSFRGIEYEATLVPEKAHAAAQPQGPIFVKDTAFRTTAAKATGAKQKCIWTIKSWDTIWEEKDVGGRSYVTSELISVTQGSAAIELAMRTGKFQEAAGFLNNRMQNAAARDIGQRTNRRATVGAAVAPGQPLVLGEDVVE